MRYVISLALLLFPVFAFQTPALPAEEQNKFLESVHEEPIWIGDFEGMVKRRLIRVLVVPNKMLYFIDRGHHRGIDVEVFKAFETYINKRMKTRTLKIRIVFLPVPRDQLFPKLEAGYGDIASANLTITKERLKMADFSQPMLTNVKEILVTGPSAPPVTTLDDLSGKEIYLRKSSSYYEHAVRLNNAFIRSGKTPVSIVPANEFMEDSDLLEMVNAGLIPMIIVDDHKANFWGQIFKKVSLHPDIYINQGGKIAWAFRKNSPRLAKIVNDFSRRAKKGTLLGNVLFTRYLEENKWARNALNPKALDKYQSVVALFKKYSHKYDFDFLMTVALAYQESQLDNNKRSRDGAVGIMQILPSTAADNNVGIKNIKKIENNIHAGHKYLRFLQDRYYSDPEIDTLDRYLLTFAAYNAGPVKINRIRREAKKKGLDHNVWFQNVEVIAARRIGRETVQYVSNIYKYYISFKLSQDKLLAAQKEKAVNRNQK